MDSGVKGYYVSGTLCQSEASLCETVGSTIDSSDHTFYNYPECKEKVWVVRGAPYKGTCAKCIEKESVFMAPVSVVGGFFRS